MKIIFICLLLGSCVTMKKYTHDKTVAYYDGVYDGLNACKKAMADEIKKIIENLDNQK